MPCKKYSHLFFFENGHSINCFLPNTFQIQSLILNNSDSKKNYFHLRIKKVVFSEH
jgi:hypothetical protein